MGTHRAAFFCLVAMLAALATSCGVVFETEGSGTITTETRSVSGFNEIAVSGSGDVIVEAGDEESLTIEADDNLLELLTSEVSGDRLELGVKTLQRIRPSRTIVYRVTVIDLAEFDISGSADVTITGLATGSFEASISGSGDIDVVGQADDLTVRISGSGSYDGGDLVTATGDVSISGSGSATVNATDELDISISGSGSVTYLGNPSLRQSISGSGSVSQR